MSNPSPLKPAGNSHYTTIDLPILTRLQLRTESSRLFIQEIFDASCNLCLLLAPTITEVDALIHKSNVVMEHLADISAMLDQVESAS